MRGTEHKKTAWEIKKGPTLFHFSRILPHTMHIRYFVQTTSNQTMDRGPGRANVNVPHVITIAVIKFLFYTLQCYRKSSPNLYN